MFRITWSTILLACIFLFTSCSNIGEKRSLLAAAGFKTVPATTPAQIAKLRNLKSGKLIPLTGKKGTVYLFADVAKKTLMVGTPAQYQEYRKLKLRQQKIDEKLLSAQVNMDDTNWNAWDNAESATWGWGIASDPL